MTRAPWPNDFAQFTCGRAKERVGKTEENVVYRIWKELLYVWQMQIDAGLNSKIGVRFLCDASTVTYTM